MLDRAAPRRGHRLHQAAARLAAVQPRRRLDHARRADPVPRSIDRGPAREATPGSHGSAVGAGRRRRGRRSRSSTRTSTCSSSTRPPASSCIPPAGTARTRSRSCSRPAAAGGEPERAGIVHRLDRDTSGLLVVARSDEAHRRLQAALARRLITREYLALVEGRPPARTGTIEAPIGRDPRVRTRMTDRRRGCARGAHALHARARAARQLAAARCGSTPAARTRSACTCARSGIPCAATPSTARPACSACERQFLHAARLSLRAPDHRRADRRAPRRCPTTCVAALAPRRADILSRLRPSRPVRSRIAALPGRRGDHATQ